MSRLELPDDLYDQEYIIAVADQLPKCGGDLLIARREAQWVMEHCFIRRSTSLQCDYEADYAEYIEDMSLGGKPFEPYRTR